MFPVSLINYRNIALQPFGEMFLTGFVLGVASRNISVSPFTDISAYNCFHLRFFLKQNLKVLGIGGFGVNN